MPESDRARLRRREIGFVFQSDNLLPFLTATENVSLQCSLAGAGDSDGDARSLELLAELGLAEEAASSRTSSPADSASASRWPAR